MPHAGSSVQTAPMSTVWQTRLQSEICRACLNLGSSKLIPATDQCKSLGFRPPAYQECSDRRGKSFQEFNLEAHSVQRPGVSPSTSHRPSFSCSHRYFGVSYLTRLGGRTAWSSTVEVNGAKHQARYWYDGTWINNAREDAAEVALQHLGVINTPRSPHVHFYGAITA